MTKKQKKVLVRIIVSAVLLLAAAVFAYFTQGIDFYFHLIAFLPAYLTVGADVLWHALVRLFRGRLFDEAFLMAIATVGALVIGEYHEAVFVMLFYRVGELFEGLATRRARKSLASLASLVPDTARVVEEDGTAHEVDAEDVPVGSFVRVLAGERIPLDSVVAEGHAALDLSALTGEALPADVTVGASVAAGAICLDGVLTLRTTRVAEESTAARILEMVENATDRKAKTETFISRFARVYTPIVCALALITGVLLFVISHNWRESLYAALSFLVVSCPCALVISVPLAFFAGIGGGAKRGVLFKGSRELERLASVRAAAFDKTGTLTHGSFSPTVFAPAEDVTEETLFSIAAALESASAHPIARSVTGAYRARYPERMLPAPTDVFETAGGGVLGMIEGKRAMVGNRRFVSDAGIAVPEIDASGAVLYVALDEKYLGAIVVTDSVRADTPAALAALRRAGISPLILISGDRRAVAEEVGASLGLDGVYAECLPADKAQVLAKEKEKTGKRMLFVGDGINDAPTLASADCGMAMGALGSDAAAFSADVVLLRDGLSGAADAVRVARRTVRIVRGNIVFILAVKTAVLLLSAFSIGGMWAAVFADVGVSVISILFAMRAGRVKPQ